MIEKIWSGDVGLMHVDFKTQSLLGHPNPPPGLRKAAAAPFCGIRSVHPHCPFGVKFWFAWTETQYFPPLITHWVGNVISKLGPVVTGTAGYVQTAGAPGNVP